MEKSGHSTPGSFAGQSPIKTPPSPIRVTSLLSASPEVDSEIPRLEFLNSEKSEFTEGTADTPHATLPQSHIAEPHISSSILFCADPIHLVGGQRGSV